MKYVLLLTGFLACLLLPQAAISQQPESSVVYGSNPESGRWMNTRGISIYYEMYGKGTPLLLIHGNGGSISSMQEQIPCFAKYFQVIIADSRAQGRSSDTGDSLSYEMMADDLSAMLDSLQLDSAYVVGWSDGGIIGLLMAIRHPEKVIRLAETGANIRPDSSALSNADIRYMIDHAAILEKQVLDPNTRNELKLTRLMIREPNITREMLQQIRCPVLVIGGDHDLIRPEHTMEIFRSIPHASLWILPGSGHDTCIRFRDDFNGQVLRFFR